MYLQRTNRQSFIEPAKRPVIGLLRDLEQVLDPAR